MYFLAFIVVKFKSKLFVLKISTIVKLLITRNSFPGVYLPPLNKYESTSLVSSTPQIRVLTVVYFIGYFSLSFTHKFPTVYNVIIVKHYWHCTITPHHNLWPTLFLLIVEVRFYNTYIWFVGRGRLVKYKSRFKYVVFMNLVSQHVGRWPPSAPNNKCSGYFLPCLYLIDTWLIIMFRCCGFRYILKYICTLF